MDDDSTFDVRYLTARSIASIKNDLYALAEMADPKPSFQEFRDRYIDALLCDALLMAYVEAWNHVPKAPIGPKLVASSLQKLAAKLGEIASDLDTSNDYAVAILRRERSF